MLNIRDLIIYHLDSKGESFLCRVVSSLFNSLSHEILYVAKMEMGVGVEAGV